MRAFLTFRGMYKNYPALFNDLQLPAQADRETVIGSLIYRSDELEVYISDPVILADAIKYYSLARLQTWARMASALGLKYDPLDGYYETSTRTPDLTYKDSSRTSGQSDGSTNSRTDDRATNSATGYNSGEMVDSTRTESEGLNDTTTSTKTGGTADSTRTETGTDTTTRHGRSQTGASLVQSELTIAQSNLTDFIVNDLRTQFCLMVY